MSNRPVTVKSFPELVPIERVEREAWLDIFAAAPGDDIGRSVTSARLGTVGVIADRETPAVVVNRAIGIGIEHPVAEAAVADAASWLRQHGNSTWGLQIAPTIDATELEAWTSRHGLKNSGNALAKFYREPLPPNEDVLASRWDVRVVEPDAAADFGRVLQTGTPVPPHFAPWISALVGRPRWTTYLAYDGDVPVASGAMFIDDGWAWLGVDATLPAYRRRGAQAALIARRIADGIAAGVAGFTAETGYPLPGTEASHPSYRNYRRAGFHLPYTRVQYIPA